MNEYIHDMFVMSPDLLAPCANRCLGVGRVDDECMVDTTTNGKAFYLLIRDCDDNWIWCRDSDSNCYIVSDIIWSWS